MIYLAYINVWTRINSTPKFNLEPLLSLIKTPLSVNNKKICRALVDSNWQSLNHHIFKRNDHRWNIFLNLSLRNNIFQLVENNSAKNGLLISRKSPPPPPIATFANIFFSNHNRWGRPYFDTHLHLRRFFEVPKTASKILQLSNSFARVPVNSTRVFGAELNFWNEIKNLYN